MSAYLNSSMGRANRARAAASAGRWLGLALAVGSILALSATGLQAQVLRDDPFALSPYPAAGNRAAADDATVGTDSESGSDNPSSLLRRLGERQEADDDRDASALQPRARGFLQDGDIADPQQTDGPVDGSFATTRPEGSADGDLGRDGRFGVSDGSVPGSEAPQFAGDGSAVAADGTIDRLPPDPLALSEGDEALVNGAGSAGGAGAAAARQAEREAAADPYAALGVRVGSFLLFPEITAGTAYSDNVFNSNTNQKSDFAFEVAPSLRLRSNWSNHEIEATVASQNSFHKTYDSEDDRQFNAGLRGRLDVTRQTNLEGELSYALTQQSRGSVELAEGAAERPDVETTTAALTLNQRFNRLGLRLRGGVTELANGDTVLADGAVSSGRDEDYRERVLALRTSYEFSPALTVFADTEVNDRQYGAPNESDLIKRDADGYELRGGAITEIGPTIRGEISVGYGRREAEDSRLDAVSGWLADANLAWRPTALTTLTLSAASDINSTTLAGSLGSISRTVGVELRHEFRRYAIATAGVTWTTQDYESVALTEDTVLGSLGVEYLLSREASLTARYQHTRFDSSEAGRDYNVNAIYAGLRLKR